MHTVSAITSSNIAGIGLAPRAAPSRSGRGLSLGGNAVTRADSGKRARGSWYVGWGLALLLPAMMGTQVECGRRASIDFERISEYGFDEADHALDKNDYPWTMVYFAPDESKTGYIYVGTGNAIARLTSAELATVVTAELGLEIPVEYLLRPPEIRRYRPDLGPRTWETVLDYRDIETGEPWQTSGFRASAVYENPQGDTHLYVGTLGFEPAIWRTASGEPGSWEQIWTNSTGGSVRALRVHNGLLYIAVTHEYFGDVAGAGGSGEIYATDGDTFWLVNGDGFGNADNTGVFELASFNGWLYAGTLNRNQGYEVWKLEGPGGQTDPVPVVTQGGPSPANMGAGTMCIFGGRLYVGALNFLALNLHGGQLIRGADLIRINADDSWETVVGPGSAGGVTSGFGNRSNGYVWSLVEHNGKLYCGTFDAATFLRLLQVGLPDLRALIEYYTREEDKRDPRLFDIVVHNGAELYVSDDGVNWSMVFRDGLGNPDNYGVRQLMNINGELIMGLSNVFDGLSVWRARLPLDTNGETQ